MHSQSMTFYEGPTNNRNGQCLPSSQPLSPVHSNDSNTKPKATAIDNASLEELDRIMDTLSTLSRSTSLGRGRTKHTNAADSMSPQSSDTSEGVRSMSPVSPLSPASPLSSTNSPYLPPRMTSPASITPMVQSPTRYAPSNFERKSLKSNNKPSIENPPSQSHFGGNKQVSRSRFPSEYENTNQKNPQEQHVSNKQLRKYSSNPYEHIVPDVSNSITAANHSDGNSSNRYFYGPLPMSPRTTTKRESDDLRNFPPQHNSNQRSTGEVSNKMPYQSLANMGQDPYGTARAEFGSSRNTPGFPRTSIDEGRKQSGMLRKEYNTLDGDVDNAIPRYNDKKSYLSNLENGTLPRSKLDVQRQQEIDDREKKNRKSSELGGDMYNFNSLSRKKRLKNKMRATKPSSQQSRSSYTSYSDNGRGYASVSTAPARNSLIQTDIFSTNKQGSHHLNKTTTTAPTTRPTENNTCCGSDSFCLRCGRYLHNHLLEFFILAAFCAAIPIGIIVQALNFHSSFAFSKYVSFFGFTMVLNILSTLTPITVFASVLCAASALPLQAFKKMSLFMLIFILLSLVVASCLSAGVVLTIKPGMVATNETAIFEGSNLSFPTSTNEVYYFNSAYHQNKTASTELLLLLRLFFPGCGNSDPQLAVGMCNMFVLIIFALALGITIASSGSEGRNIRKMIAKLGTIIVKMNTIFMWYLPFGVLVIVSEFIATKIDWANIGHDGRTMDSFVNNVSGPNIFPYRNTSNFHDHLKWYLLCVFLSLSVYGLLLLPLLVAIATRSNPLSLLGCRSLAPLLISIATGFSDLCIPVTSRCFYKQRKRSDKDSMCCFATKVGVDQRLGQFSAVVCGIFYRAGSLIVIVCSSLFYAQVHGEQLHAGGVIFICISSLVASIVSISGKWFQYTNPYFQSIVIALQSAGITSPVLYPRLLFCMWIVYRLAAFVDTLSDLLLTYLINHICKNELEKVIDIEERRCSDAYSNAETKLTALPTPKLPTKLPHKLDQENGSDYDDAPLLFNTYYEENGSGESISEDGKEQNNDVFYASTSSTAERNHKISVKSSSNGSQNQNSNNNTPKHYVSKHNNTNQVHPVALVRYNTNCENNNNKTGLVHTNNNNNNREETSFVTF